MSRGVEAQAPEPQAAREQAPLSALSPGSCALLGPTAPWPRTLALQHPCLPHQREMSKLHVLHRKQKASHPTKATHARIESHTDGDHGRTDGQTNSLIGHRELAQRPRLHSGLRTLVLPIALPSPDCDSLNSLPDGQVHLLSPPTHPPPPPPPAQGPGAQQARGGHAD